MTTARDLADGHRFISCQDDDEPWALYHHFIDNRITRIDDWYYIVTPVMVQGFESPIGMLGRTKDFSAYERIEIITGPRNRGASLFPEKIGGNNGRSMVTAIIQSSLAGRLRTTKETRYASITAPATSQFALQRAL